jgi:cytochrome c biogenesis protein CcmG/thiol:disulfide interchange protein DsbE
MRTWQRVAVIAAIHTLLLAAPAGAAIKIKKESQRKRAPQFELQDAEGGTIRLSDYAGKVVLLDFWATWCAPCQGSIPWLKELSEQYRGAGLAVIGISMDEEGWEVVKPFVEKMKITYPIAVGNKRTAYLYGGVDSLPLAFFIDRDQRVAAIHLGAADRNAFEKTIERLLRESR